MEELANRFQESKLFHGPGYNYVCLFVCVTCGCGVVLIVCSLVGGGGSKEENVFACLLSLHALFFGFIINSDVCVAHNYCP